MWGIKVTPDGGMVDLGLIGVSNGAGVIGDWRYNQYFMGREALGQQP